MFSDPMCVCRTLAPCCSSTTLREWTLCMRAWAVQVCVCVCVSECVCMCVCVCVRARAHLCPCLVCVCHSYASLRPLRVFESRNSTLCHRSACSPGQAFGARRPAAAGVWVCECVCTCVYVRVCARACECL